MLTHTPQSFGEYNAIQLVNLAELDIQLVYKIYETRINRSLPTELDVWRLFANNAFYDCVSITHTLLSPTKEEINISELLGVKDTEATRKFESLQKEWKETGLLKLRHHSIDHKNEHNFDPAGAPTQLLRDKLIDDLQKVVVKLAEFLRTQFRFESNNRYSSILNQIDSI